MNNAPLYAGFLMRVIAAFRRKPMTTTGPKGPFDNRPRQSKRIGWWRGVPYELPKSIELQLSAKRPPQIVYWRGSKIEMPFFEFPPSIEGSIHRGYWRGSPCNFYVAMRATVI